MTHCALQNICLSEIRVSLCFRLLWGPVYYVMYYVPSGTVGAMGTQRYYGLQWDTEGYHWVSWGIMGYYHYNVVPLGTMGYCGFVHVPPFPPVAWKHPDPTRNPIYWLIPVVTNGAGKNSKDGFGLHRLEQIACAPFSKRVPTVRP